MTIGIAEPPLDLVTLAGRMTLQEMLEPHPRPQPEDDSPLLTAPFLLDLDSLLDSHPVQKGRSITPKSKSIERQMQAPGQTFECFTIQF